MRQRKYTDIDLNFSMHPESHDVSKIRDNSAIIRAVRNLVKTSYYDAPFQPTKGNFVAGALFENDMPSVDDFITNEINNVLEIFEPRAKDVQVRTVANLANNEIRVDISFTPEGEIYSVDFNIVLERTR
jgi:hypothetical protein